MNDGELMTLRADALFTYDKRGRMLRSNEPREDARRPAPRVFLGRTLTGHVVRFRAALPNDVVRRLTDIIERQPPLADLSDAPIIAPAVLAGLRESLERQAPISQESAGPAYRFPDSVAQASEVVRLTGANRELARDTFPWLYAEVADWQPCFAIVMDGAAVSVCYSSRSASRVDEAGVDTLPEFRGRGYASIVTAAWAGAVRAAGREPVYSTSWENAASQGVARRLGLIIFGVDASWS